MNPFTHKHKWTSIAASSEEAPERDGMFGRSGGWYTTILQKCHGCGELNASTVRGRFALGDILGVSPTDSVEKLIGK